MSRVPSLRLARDALFHSVIYGNVVMDMKKIVTPLYLDSRINLHILPLEMLAKLTKASYMIHFDFIYI